MTTRPGYAWDAATNQWIEIGTSVAESPVYFQATPPVSAPTGSIWVDSDAFVPSIDSAQMLRWRKTMTGGQTSLSGTDDNGLSLQYTPNYEQVYINGVLQVRGQDYTATTGTTITGITALVANDVVEVFSVVARAVADVYTQAQSDSKYATNARSGMTLVVPTSIVKGASGSASVSANGAVTFSGTESIRLKGVFKSAYDNYRILFSNLFPSTSNFFTHQLYNNDTVNTGTWNSQRQYTQNTTVGGSLFTGDTYGRSAYIGSPLVNFVTMDIMNPAIAQFTKTLSEANYSDPTYYTYIEKMASVHLVQAAYDGISFYVASGTIGGTIRIYGYNNGA